MNARRLLALVSLLIAACGAAERPAPEAPSLPTEPEPSAETLPEADAGIDAAEPEPEPLAVEAPPPGPPDLGPIDQRPTPCFTEARATRFATPPDRYPGSHFEVVVRGSAAFDRAGQLHASPGTTLTFEVTIENVGTEELGLSERDAQALNELHVVGLSAQWTMPVSSPSELRAGQRLAPGAMIRLCTTFEIAREPIDAAPPRERERVYNLDWMRGGHEGLGVRGGYLGTGGRQIIVRYPASRGPSVREAESWGGVLRVRIAEGGSVLTIARETGMRIGSGVQLFTGRGGPDEPVRRPIDEVLMQAPETMRVADAATALAARPDVLGATPLLHGEPGTEGCSDHSPCGRGEQCCYLCGIPGCAPGCFRGARCPNNIP